MKMKMKSMLIAFALGLVSGTLPAAAQFKLPDFVAPGSTPSHQTTTEAVTDFYAIFLTARLDMNQSQIHLANAFELKEQVALLEAEQARLAEGNLTASDVKDSVQLSNKASEAIDARIQEGAELSEEGQQYFIQALPYLVSGTLLTIELPNRAQSYVDQLRRDAQSANYMQKAQIAIKLKDGAQVAHQMPSYIRTTATNYKLVMGYGKDHSMPIPEDATDVLGSL
ncbi:MAG TPA: hypothetical protein DHV57_05480 [Hyphomonas sp.]|nr:hypothetical protein [Hyphomonadaceae bacterium]HCJ16855.1 hypothetical protein [Hyphomonas sp.]